MLERLFTGADKCVQIRAICNVGWPFKALPGRVALNSQHMTFPVHVIQPGFQVNIISTVFWVHIVKHPRVLDLDVGGYPPIALTLEG